MEYTLMHKDIPVLDIDPDEATSSVRKILTTYRPEHLPLGTSSKHGDVDRAALKRKNLRRLGMLTFFKQGLMWIMRNGDQTNS